MAAVEHERSDETRSSVRQHDRGRRHLRALEQRHERVRERAEDELEDELTAGSPRLGRCGRDRHRRRW
jgi:hypothetical protein